MYTHSLLLFEAHGPSWSWILVLMGPMGAIWRQCSVVRAKASMVWLLGCWQPRLKGPQALLHQAEAPTSPQCPLPGDGPQTTRPTPTANPPCRCVYTGLAGRRHSSRCPSDGRPFARKQGVRRA